MAQDTTTPEKTLKISAVDTATKRGSNILSVEISNADVIPAHTTRDFIAEPCDYCGETFFQNFSGIRYELEFGGTKASTFISSYKLIDEINRTIHLLKTKFPDLQPVNLSKIASGALEEHVRQKLITIHAKNPNFRITESELVHASAKSDRTLMRDSEVPRMSRNGLGKIMPAESTSSSVFLCKSRGYDFHIPVDTKNWKVNLKGHMSSLYSNGGAMDTLFCDSHTPPEHEISFGIAPSANSISREVLCPTVEVEDEQIRKEFNLPKRKLNHPPTEHEGVMRNIAEIAFSAEKDLNIIQGLSEIQALSHLGIIELANESVKTLLGSLVDTNSPPKPQHTTPAEEVAINNLQECQEALEDLVHATEAPQQEVFKCLHAADPGHNTNMWTWEHSLKPFEPTSKQSPQFGFVKINLESTMGEKWCRAFSAELENRKLPQETKKISIHHGGEKGWFVIPTYYKQSGETISLLNPDFTPIRYTELYKIFNKIYPKLSKEEVTLHVEDVMKSLHILGRSCNMLQRRAKFITLMDALGTPDNNQNALTKIFTSFLSPSSSRRTLDLEKFMDQILFTLADITVPTALVSARDGNTLTSRINSTSGRVMRSVRNSRKLALTISRLFGLGAGDFPEWAKKNKAFTKNLVARNVLMHIYSHPELHSHFGYEMEKFRNGDATDSGKIINSWMQHFPGPPSFYDQELQQLFDHLRRDNKSAPGGWKNTQPLKHHATTMKQGGGFTTNVDGIFENVDQMFKSSLSHVRIYKSAQSKFPASISSPDRTDVKHKDNRIAMSLQAIRMADTVIENTVLRAEHNIYTAKGKSGIPPLAVVSAEHFRDSHMDRVLRNINHLHIAAHHGLQEEMQKNPERAKKIYEIILPNLGHGSSVYDPLYDTLYDAILSPDAPHTEFLKKLTLELEHDLYRGTSAGVKWMKHKSLGLRVPDNTLRALLHCNDLQQPRLPESDSPEHYRSAMIFPAGHALLSLGLYGTFQFLGYSTPPELKAAAETMKKKIKAALKNPDIIFLRLLTEGPTKIALLNEPNDNGESTWSTTSTSEMPRTTAYYQKLWIAYYDFREALGSIDVDKFFSDPRSLTAPQNNAMLAALPYCADLTREFEDEHISPCRSFLITSLLHLSPALTKDHLKKQGIHGNIHSSQHAAKHEKTLIPMVEDILKDGKNFTAGSIEFVSGIVTTFGMHAEYKTLIKLQTEKNQSQFLSGHFEALKELAKTYASKLKKAKAWKISEQDNQAHKTVNSLKHIVERGEDNLKYRVAKYKTVSVQDPRATPNLFLTTKELLTENQGQRVMKPEDLLKSYQEIQRKIGNITPPQKHKTITIDSGARLRDIDEEQLAVSELTTRCYKNRILPLDLANGLDVLNGELRSCTNLVTHSDTDDIVLKENFINATQSLLRCAHRDSRDSEILAGYGITQPSLDARKKYRAQNQQLGLVSKARYIKHQEECANKERGGKRLTFNEYLTSRLLQIEAESFNRRELLQKIERAGNQIWEMAKERSDFFKLEESDKSIDSAIKALAQKPEENKMCDKAAILVRNSLMKSSNRELHDALTRVSKSREKLAVQAWEASIEALQRKNPNHKYTIKDLATKDIVLSSENPQTLHAKLREYATLCGLSKEIALSYCKTRDPAVYGTKYDELVKQLHNEEISMDDLLDEVEIQDLTGKEKAERQLKRNQVKKASLDTENQARAAIQARRAKADRAEDPKPSETTAKKSEDKPTTEKEESTATTSPAKSEGERDKKKEKETRENPTKDKVEPSQFEQEKEREGEREREKEKERRQGKEKDKAREIGGNPNPSEATTKKSENKPVTEKEESRAATSPPKSEGERKRGEEREKEKGKKREKEKEREQKKKEQEAKEEETPATTATPTPSKKAVEWGRAKEKTSEDKKTKTDKKDDAAKTASPNSTPQNGSNSASSESENEAAEPEAKKQQENKTKKGSATEENASSSEDEASQGVKDFDQRLEEDKKDDAAKTTSPNSTPQNGSNSASSESKNEATEPETKKQQENKTKKGSATEENASSSEDEASQGVKDFDQRLEDLIEQAKKEEIRKTAEEKAAKAKEEKEEDERKAKEEKEENERKAKEEKELREENLERIKKLLQSIESVEKNNKRKNDENKKKASATREDSVQQKEKIGSLKQELDTLRQELENTKKHKRSLEDNLSELLARQKRQRAAEGGRYVEAELLSLATGCARHAIEFDTSGRQDVENTLTQDIGGLYSSFTYLPVMVPVSQNGRPALGRYLATDAPRTESEVRNGKKAVNEFKKNHTKIRTLEARINQLNCETGKEEDRSDQGESGQSQYMKLAQLKSELSDAQKAVTSNKILAEFYGLQYPGDKGVEEDAQWIQTPAGHTSLIKIPEPNQLLLQEDIHSEIAVASSAENDLQEQERELMQGIREAEKELERIQKKITKAYQDSAKQHNRQPSTGENLNSSSNNRGQNLDFGGNQTPGESSSSKSSPSASGNSSLGGIAPAPKSPAKSAPNPQGANRGQKGAGR